MVRVAVVKIRSPFEPEWQPGRGLTYLIRLAMGWSPASAGAGSSGRPLVAQLTLPYLAALVRDHGERRGTPHEVRFLDVREDEAFDLLCDRFDLVLFTATTNAAPGSYRISDALRRRGVATVLGGIHPSTLPEEAGRHATSVAIGEAESVMDDLLDDFCAGRGLAPVYRGGLRADLAGLVVPAWDASDVPEPCSITVPIETSRGCRNACAFCSTTRFQGARRRHRPVEEIVAEIRALREQGVLSPGKSIFFTDNNIVADSDHRRGIRDTTYARRFFEALIPLGIDWTGQGEMSVADDPELVALMAASGCRTILLGIESLDPANLAALGKPCNLVEQYRRRIAVFHDCGIAIMGALIVGIDGDRAETFGKVLEFVSREVEVPQLCALTPFPGTALRRRLQREGRIASSDWSLYDGAHAVIHTPHLARPELAELYARLGRRAFSLPRILRRAIRHARRRVRPGVSAPSPMSRFESVVGLNLAYRLITLSAQRALDPARAFAEGEEESGAAALTAEHTLEELVEA